MAEVAIKCSENNSDYGRDKEFDAFIGETTSPTGSPSESKENVGESNGAVGASVVTNDLIQWRAKRPSTKFVLNRTNSDSLISAPLRALKNSRKSRSGFGRGLPKKGGAGGKGTWGALGSEVLEEGCGETGTLDPNDPNYDELSSKDVQMVTSVGDRKPAALQDEDICKALHTTIVEYYDHGDTEEVFLAVEELGWSSEQRHLLVVTAVEVALDHKPSHREMTSVMLADLYNHSLKEQHYAKGYDQLIRNLDDLVIDTPTAPTVLANFVARSIADDCIPPKFLSGYIGQFESDHPALCLSRAQSMLSMRHGLVRLDNVWGVGGGMRPVKHLVKKMSLLLHEFLSSADVEEAQRCLLELEVPHFNHELVYEAIVLALERLDDRTLTLVTKLLGALQASVVVTPHQMREGFVRVYEDMPQISLDVPHAYAFLDKFVKKCVADNIIADDVARKMPTRGRKRFVSEGDGGRVKDGSYC